MSPNAVQIIGIAVNVIMGLINASVMIWLGRRQIQATLHPAQPAPKPKRKKILGPKQRRIITGLRLLRVISVSSAFNAMMDVLQVFLYPSSNRKLDALLAVSAVIAIAGAVWMLIIAQKTIRKVKAGNRAVIDDWYKIFRPRSLREL